MCRPPVRDENVRIANCANCHFKIQDRGEVCAQSSAARAAMGHWGHSPHIPGMAGQCVVTFGGQTHTTTTTFGVADTVFDGSNCSSGVVRWCAHHLQHLGSPWGIGAMPPHPRDGRTLLGYLWGPHTHHHGHIRRSRHRIRRFELQFGCRTVVCTPSSASRVAMGHWGQCPHTPGMAGHCLVTFGGGTQTPPRPHSALPTPYSTAVRVAYGGVHVILSI